MAKEFPKAVPWTIRYRHLRSSDRRAHLAVVEATSSGGALANWLPMMPANAFVEIIDVTCRVIDSTKEETNANG